MQRTPEEIAAEVIMTRTDCKSLILLVEGSSDVKTFRKFISSADSEIIPSWGKDNVLGAIAILEKESFQGVLGIIDADFSHLDGENKSSKNIIVTDDHDIEMMMIRSKSFSYFIGEVASDSKMKRFLESINSSDIREVLLERALVIGHLRRYSLRNNLNIRFEGLDFEKFIKKDSINLELSKLVDCLLMLTRDSRLRAVEIISQISLWMDANSGDPYQICCGHDVIAILEIGLSKCIGSKPAKEANIKVLESQLRMSYDSACFRQTLLYKAAKKWSLDNPQYPVFDSFEIE